MGRLLVGAALVVALGSALGTLEGRFEAADVRRGITRTLAFRPAPERRSVLEALEALGEGAPSCGGDVVSGWLGDVRVACTTPRRPELVYTFRVLVGGERSPRPESHAARTLVAAEEHAVR